MKETKKAWSAPVVTIYGDVEQLTQDPVKPKQPGSSDDFAVAGISDA
jgi:hypothetical protein